MGEILYFLRRDDDHIDRAVVAILDYLERYSDDDAIEIVEDVLALLSMEVVG